MFSSHINLGSLFLLVLALIGIVWGVRLWTKPQRYNSKSLLHRQIYLWYVGWFGKTLDATYQLDNREVQKAALVITILAVVTLVLAVLSILLL
ncbi:MAG: hypothetical protein CVU38_20325 [Chloroflexi bacterium HGW-Chloroflexi-1]|nr:MAG: hypothetical protein CVU38_20325 [Chloroflexi bacterium HGW-Chloroflexi-1]